MLFERGRRLALLGALCALVAVPSLVSTATGASSAVRGPDVSRYQHPTDKPIDWAAVKRSGASFTFVKATQSTSKTDPWFAREWAAAGKAGLVRGAYHFSDPTTSADAQAAHVVAVVGTTREAGDLPIVLDLESTGGLSSHALSTWAHTFLSGVERRTGRVPILYTYPSFWHTAMADDTSFGAYPLWLATFSSTEPATLPGWKHWTWWQHSDHSSVPGIPGGVDESYLCCASGVLAALSDGRSGPITALWRKLGGASGTLGLPTGPEQPVPGGGWSQTFQNGYVATSSRGTHAVTSPIWQRYVLSGGAGGALGPPTGDVFGLPNGGLGQAFTGGSIVWTRLTGAHSVRGGYLVRWQKDGGAKGVEGMPTAEAVGKGQQFSRGGLYGTPTGIRMVPGAIRDRYEQLGGASSPLGLPAAEPGLVLGAVTQRFDLGVLTEVKTATEDVVV